jgi:hypothetical protein
MQGFVHSLPLSGYGAGNPSLQTLTRTTPGTEPVWEATSCLRTTRSLGRRPPRDA